MITTIKSTIKSPLDELFRDKNESIKGKVKIAWSKKTDNTNSFYENKNIEFKKNNHIDIINKLKYVNINKFAPTKNKNISSEYNRYNFLLLYKKLSNLSVTEREAFISDIIKLLNKNNLFQHQEPLKKAVETALNKVIMVNLALEPLITQMNYNIANTTIEESDDDDELIFN